MYIFFWRHQRILDVMYTHIYTYIYNIYMSTYSCFCVYTYSFISFTYNIRKIKYINRKKINIKIENEK